jgi:hypothetical protein
MTPNSWQAGGLVLAIAAQAAASPSSEITITIDRIGQAAVQKSAESEAPQQGTAYYYVDPRESVALSLSGPLPRRARLYPLVRREGASAWIVQPEAVAMGSRNGTGKWLAEVRFGAHSETGARLEMMVIAAAEPLPPLPLPTGLRRASTLAESSIIRVERRAGRPSVGVSRIGGTEIRGDQELEVHEMATVEVVARDLPATSRAGVVIHPIDTDRRWVMNDVFGDGTHEVTSYFGTGEQGEDFFRYTVSAFVAWRNQMPPRDRPIPPQEWEEYQSRFLAESRLVPVVRWEGDFRIKSIGGLAVLPDRALLVSPQEDVHGAVQRKLQNGERIWIVCVPRNGEPWVAGSTRRLLSSGQWTVNAAALWPPGKPLRFDVVAVISAARPPLPARQPAAGEHFSALRAWVYDEERPRHSVHVQVKP